MLAKAILNLPVYTQRGVSLGKVANMEINSQTHEVVKYFVQSGWGVKKIVGDVPELIVAPSQVVELTRERMIVKDAVTPEEESALKEVKASVASTVRSATLAQTREEPAKAAE